MHTSAAQHTCQHTWLYRIYYHYYYRSVYCSDSDNTLSDISPLKGAHNVLAVQDPNPVRLPDNEGAGETGQGEDGANAFCTWMAAERAFQEAKAAADAS